VSDRGLACQEAKGGKVMFFRKDWKARRVMSAEEQQVIERARQEWMGCRVWIGGWDQSRLPQNAVVENGRVYGEVAAITEQGRVRIVIGLSEHGIPCYYECNASALGIIVLRVID